MGRPAPTARMTYGEYLDAELALGRPPRVPEGRRLGDGGRDDRARPPWLHRSPASCIRPCAASLAARSPPTFAYGSRRRTSGDLPGPVGRLRPAPDRARRQGRDYEPCLCWSRCCPSRRRPTTEARSGPTTGGSHRFASTCSFPRPSRLIEVYRRAESGRFELLEARAGESIELASIGVTLDVSAVYANPRGAATA